MLDALPARAVVILDDMQWADGESLELFRGRAIGASLAGGGHLSRSRPELGHPLAQRLAEVQRQRSCEYLPLASLSRRGARTRPDSAEREAYLETLAQRLMLHDPDPLVGEMAAQLREHDVREQFLAGVEILLTGITAQTTDAGSSF